MKRLIGLVLALVGAALIMFAAYHLLMTKMHPYGYHPMVPGLLGIALLTVGLIWRQE